MSLRLAVDHPNRLVVGVAAGAMTLEDLAGFAQDIVRAEWLPYSKLIDVTHCTLQLTSAEVSAFTRALQNVRRDIARGPLAVVVLPSDQEAAAIFAALDFGKRPAEIFRSIHDARRWIRNQIPDHGWTPARRV